MSDFNQTVAAKASGLLKSMRPVASFTFNNRSEASVKLCLFPGHYMLAESISIATSSTNPVKITSYLSYANPEPIRNAGYECDQVADDFNCSLNHRDGSEGQYSVEVKQKSVKTRYRDFLNYIKLSGVRVAKMRITDLDTSANPSRLIFQSEMEVSKSQIGSKAASDFIQLSSHINPSNFLQNFIEIDLEKQNLLLDETTLAFLEIPGKAHFQIDFTLAD